jgi:hypothetical protein
MSGCSLGSVVPEEVRRFCFVLQKPFTVGNWWKSQEMDLDIERSIIRR